MKYDYKFGTSELSVLSSLIGKRLEAYRLNDTDNSSFEIFVLRFSDKDVEFVTKEIVGLNEWFDETNTVEVNERPERDSWSRVGKTEPDNGIPAGEFMDYRVGKIVAGISIISETFSNDEDSIEFMRGIIINLGNESILFDKGALNWENIWRVSKVTELPIKVPSAEFDPIEELGLRSVTTITPISVK